MNNGENENAEIPLSADRRELFELLRKKKLSDQAAAKKILRVNSQVAPLSSAQQRMWFAYQWEPASHVYNRPAAIRLRGPLVVEALSQSLNQLVDCQEVFRTVFPATDGRPFQTILPAIPLSIPLVDLTKLASSEKEEQLRLLIKREASQPFDLEKGPVVRPLLVKLSPEEHLLLLMMHHIIFDGWSMNIILRDLRTLYAEAIYGTGFGLPELPILYADFAHWQQQWLLQPTVTKQLAYWKNLLSGPLPVLELPLDRKRPAIQQFEGATYPFVIPPVLTQQLRLFTREQDSTLFMTLLAAFRTLLYRYSNQEDIIIGVPIAGRNQLETENLIGVFINTLALRLPLDANQTFRQLVKVTQQVALQAYDHQDVPFEQLVEHLNPDRNLSHSPVFQVLFQLRNKPEQGYHCGDLLFEDYEIDSGIASQDLALEITEQPDFLKGHFVYSTALFNPETMERMAGHLLTLLKAAVTNPDQPVATLPLLNEAEQQLLSAWNDPNNVQVKGQCVHHLFEQQAEKSPDAIAVMQDGNALTYRELNTRANQLARYLQSLGVGPETIVGIGVDRSVEQIVGLLAILKADGAYLPLDVNHPRERIAFMMEDARVAVLLTREKWLLDWDTGLAKIVCLDMDWPLIGNQADTNPTSKVKPEHLMYVIYTSGSTGKPKGVMIQHDSVADYLVSVNKRFELSAADRLLQFSSINFDAAVEEIFCPLIHGSTLVLRTDEILDSIFVLMKKCTDWGVTVLDMPTAYWHLMAGELTRSGGLHLPEKVRAVIIGGEAVLSEHISIWLRRFGNYPQLFNLYGPTETTIASTIFNLSSRSGYLSDGLEVPIGYPIGNTQTYVLDPHRQLVPVGVPGELYIGGAGLARGYLNRPELTAEKFIPHPFTQVLGERLYRTGDLVRRLPDGNLVFLGRIDEQIKIRGFRVELGEVASVLAQHPDVKELAVISSKGSTEQPHLVAYVVVRSGTKEQATALRTYLKERLPDYMVPSFFVFLESLPLTLTGKVDRRVLPRPDDSDDTEALAVTPRTPTEQRLADIWAEVLPTNRVSIYDNFFSLGGHSLLVMQVISRIQQEWGLSLGIRQFFESPTVAALSSLVDAVQANASFDRSVKIRLWPRPERPVLSFSQESLWFLNRLTGEASAYRMELGMECRGALDQRVLEQCFTEIIRRHEVLRTAFPEMNEVPYQAVAPPEPICIPVTPIELSQAGLHRLEALSMEQRQAQLWQMIRAEVQQQFDLSTGPLFRLHLFGLSADWHVLVIMMHHSISDGWSLNVLNEELKTLYQAYVQNNPAALPALAIQYADYAQWQRQQLLGERFEKLLNYWKHQLAGLAPLLELPTDRPRPHRQTFAGADVVFELDAKLAIELRKLSHATDTTLFMTLMTAFKVLLGHYCRTEDVAVGMPVANRPQRELEPMIGFFVNTLVVRTDLTGNPTFRDLLSRVRRCALDAYEHQDLPFEKLVEELHPQRSLSHNPLFQVMFDMQAAPPQTMQWPQLTVQPFHPERREAKFDLGLSFVETGDAITGRLNYNTDLFNRETAERMVGHLLTLLKAIATDPLQCMARLPFLYEAEQQQLLQWGHHNTFVRKEVCVHWLFEQQVLLTPEAMAVFTEKESLTYRDLNERSNQLAHYLQSSGVGPNVVVGIGLERSVAQIVGLLGIMKAGGTYLPLDAGYPRERIQLMMNDARVAVLVTQEKLLFLSNWPLFPEKVICLDTDWPEIAQYSNLNPDNKVKPENLMYLIYTSGSTGKPKGVMTPHGAVASFLESTGKVTGIGAEDRVLQFSTINFDMATEDIFCALTQGGTLVLRNDAMLQSVEVMLEKCREWAVTALYLPTAYWHLLVTEVTQLAELAWPSSVRIVIVGGERISAQHVKIWQQRFGHYPKLFNSYGPTEATVLSTMYDCSQYTVSTDQPEVPIGYPLDNTQVYVMDPQLRLVPIGVTGELYIGGAGLACGYLNRPELTAEKFMAHPFGKPRESLYRSGDLVRWRMDGSLQYVGRTDDQVKIRGFRIELGEVETILSQYPDVKEVAVVAREDRPGEKRLVAYLVPSIPTPLDLSALRGYLQEQLPDYMVPSFFVSLEKLPLTAHGKLDRHTLPKPASRTTPEAPEATPRTPTEQNLADIWGQVLNLTNVNVHDNFFELGGHSLLAVKLISEIKRRTGQSLPLAAIFAHPTLAELAAELETPPDPAAWDSLVVIQGKGTKKPLYLIHDGWGGVEYGYQLAPFLEPDRPVYGFQAIGLNGIDAPLATIEEMAEHHLRRLLVHQPEGPYHLASFSGGGFVAFEMARRLQLMDKPVGLLTLFDSYPINHSRFTYRQFPLSYVARSIANFLVSTRIPLRNKWKAVVGKIPRVMRESLKRRQKQKQEQRMVATTVDPALQVKQACLRAYLTHRIQPYPGRLLFIRAIQNPAQFLLNFDFGWRAYAQQGVDVYDIPGNHRMLFREKASLQAIARILQEHFTKAES